MPEWVSHLVCTMALTALLTWSAHGPAAWVRAALLGALRGRRHLAESEGAARLFACNICLAPWVGAALAPLTLWPGGRAALALATVPLGASLAFFLLFGLGLTPPATLDSGAETATCPTCHGRARTANTETGAMSPVMNTADARTALRPRTNQTT